MQSAALAPGHFPITLNGEPRARVAQLDRVTASGAAGCGFDSRRAHHFLALALNRPKNLCPGRRVLSTKQVSSMSDMRLCERAKAGDEAAAAELIDRHYERIYAYLRRLCGSDVEAEDLTQRTFQKVWSSLGAFGGRSAFSTWAHGIAHNVYVDWRRRRNFMDPQTDTWWETCAAEGPSPFEDAAERELAQRVYGLVEQLDEDTRQAVHLHYYQGLSLKETCEVLGMPSSTLKYRLREALNTLRSRTAEPKSLTGERR